MVDEDRQKTKRMVIALRKLNQPTEDDRYPTPSILVILKKMGKAQLFTTLYLKSVFH